MAIGMVFFILFYLVLASIMMVLLKNIWIGLLMLIAFYMSGLFAMRYCGWLSGLSQQLKFRKLLSSRGDYIAHLKRERREILEELKAILNQSLTA